MIATRKFARGVKVSTRSIRRAVTINSKLNLQEYTNSTSAMKSTGLKEQ